MSGFAFNLGPGAVVLLYTWHPADTDPRTAGGALTSVGFMPSNPKGEHRGPFVALITAETKGGYDVLAFHAPTSTYKGVRFISANPLDRPPENYLVPSVQTPRTGIA